MEIKYIMEKAATASIEEKRLLRQELYNLVEDKYETMQKYEYRQFHFHLSNTESFLRVHTPDKYGDLLQGVRKTVSLANQNKEKIISFEEGRIFNGFRYVYPLDKDGKHVGSVELSVSSKSIIRILSELYENEDFYFLVDKSVVEEKVFQEELDNYTDSIPLEGYYLDRETKEVSDQYKSVVEGCEKKLFRDIGESKVDKIKAKESFASIYRIDDIDYTVSFLAISNIENTPIAYLVSIRESVGIDDFTKGFYDEILLVSLLVAVIIILGLTLAKYNYELEKSSGMDYLTNIYNRNKFYELIEREEKSSSRYGYKSSIMLFDIDHFKKINDNYGHNWGDEVLKKLASEISKNIRETDIFARWGGEEFVVFLPHTDKEGAMEVAEKLRRLVCESQIKELEEVTISIGVTSISPDDYNIDAAIKRADDAMYQAKKDGRNRVSYK